MTEIVADETRRISPEYEALLLDHYSDEIINPIVSGWQHADLPQQPGESIAYVRLNKGVGERPVLYVPGFTAGIVAKAPFAAELASLGYDVILPDQNRSGILKDSHGKKNATFTQAHNYLAVLAQENVDEVDAITESYGNHILDEMDAIAAAENKAPFANSNVVMLVPSGFTNKSRLGLAMRFVASFRNEGKGNPKEFRSPDMLKAGQGHLTANLRRALREINDLRAREFGYERLMDGRVKSLTSLNFAADALYSNRAIYKKASRAAEAGLAWAVPILQKERFDPATAKPHATHNDEQFNPFRAAAAVNQLLRP